MEIFSTDFKPEPFWWDQSPSPNIEANKMPSAVDVAIVGSGYTGLCAALVLARGGRAVTVFDAENAGWGCSSRNGGQISTSIKPSYKSLMRRFGEKSAYDIVKEGHKSLEWLKDFISSENIECRFQVPGRFYAAHSQKEFDKLQKELSDQPAGLRVPLKVVARSDQRQELGTDAYHGGAIFEVHASLDPAMYHRALLKRVLDAGVTIIPNCKVLGFKKTGTYLKCRPSVAQPQLRM